MPGTIVRDALQSKLLSAYDVSTDEDGDGKEVEHKYPLEVAAAEVTVTTILEVGTLQVTIQGSEDNSTYVDIGASGEIPADTAAGSKFLIPLYAPYRYIRATTTKTGSTTGNIDVQLVPEHTGRVNPTNGANGTTTVS